MPYALTLRLDPEAGSRVVAIQQALAARGLSDASRLEYPPHVTLAVVSDDADLARLLAAAQNLATRWPRLTTTLASMGIFPGTPAILFLAPVVTAGLLERHAELLASLAGERIDPHYETGNWVPHVTLAGDVTDVPAAVAVVGTLGWPIPAMLDAVEVVRFPPPGILARHVLTDAGRSLS